MNFQNAKLTSKFLNFYILKESKMAIQFIYIYSQTKTKKDLAILKLIGITIENKLFYQINKSFSLIPSKRYGVILYNLCFQIQWRHLFFFPTTLITPTRFLQSFGKKY